MKLFLIALSVVWLISFRDIVAAEKDNQQTVLRDDQTKRVAIIGAGAGGSSAAYYLRQYALDAGIPISLTVYERNSHIGGRTTTVHVHDDPFQPVELGASIFVQVNRNLVGAVERFGLRLSDDDEAEETSFSSTATAATAFLGIWNGREFVYVQASDSIGWWGKSKLLWKYGMAPIRTMNLMKSTVGTFLKMYEAPHFPFGSLSDTAHGLGLTSFTSSTGEQILKTHGIAAKFATDVVQASTRVNYAQNLQLIHGLETMVCMATDGAMAVRGGNWRIFDAMLNDAGARVVLNTSVTAIEERRDQDGGGFVVRSRRSTTAEREGEREETEEEAAEQHDSAFDSIILAAPYQFSNIEFSPPLTHTPSKIPYVSLHVTLFSTPHTLSPSFFNLSSSSPVPQIILTTLSPTERPSTANPSKTQAGTPGFFSISRLRTNVVNPTTQQRENVYKIFSPDKPSAAFMAKLLLDRTDEDGQKKINNESENGDAEADAEDNDNDIISWRYDRRWDSYPYLYPRITFEEIRLGGTEDKGVWYTSGMESFISTMETMSLMGMNVARLVVDGWVGKERVGEDEGEEKSGGDL
ncbi:MAG: hypothetical protein M1816_007213 [Peltula sp. TS41687]|nr:MAG: hypothetical protein M1816_007213 [Peltula sp. TS41687]